MVSPDQEPGKIQPLIFNLRGGPDNGAQVQGARCRDVIREERNTRR